MPISISTTMDVSESKDTLILILKLSVRSEQLSTNIPTLRKKEISGFTSANCIIFDTLRNARNMCEYLSKNFDS
jgi:hypothetical protein